MNSSRTSSSLFHSIKSQMKYRDEIRPRFGLMRSREFLMKDAYSFHDSWTSLDETYRQFYGAYSKILERIGLEFLVVEADSGAMEVTSLTSSTFSRTTENRHCYIATAVMRPPTKRPNTFSKRNLRRERSQSCSWYQLQTREPSMKWRSVLV
jgi:hypothetical protein